ncbi:MAG: hypothetical protein INR68_05420 [Methylobacterium mesophilicum]|nr:hypothetical protein [Methylobacterium mesophilicum]
MIRLNLTREPMRLHLGHGVAVTVMPASTAIMMAARRQASVAVGEGDDHRIAALVKAVGRLTITEWEGVGDEEGHPVEPSPERIDALLDLWPFAERFQQLYLGPALLLDAEKNASAPSPIGTSAGALDTALPASAFAPSAPIA